MPSTTFVKRSKRPAPSDDDDDEEDDIEQRRTGVINTKGKGKSTNGGKSPTKRRKVVAETDEEETSGQEDDEDDDDEGYGSSRKAKRNGNAAHTQPRRNGMNGTNGHNGNGARIILDSDEDSDGEAIEVEEGELVRQRKHIAPLQAIVRDEDGWVPGSIMRIKLHYFLTYTDVEFRPGPHLNLVIGPNGTGKSSIVCGIALGLGFPPKILGRAPDISSFVRQGKMDAFVELELKGKIGRPNAIIKRCFQRKNKSSVWTINGKSASAQQVNDAVTELGIQVDNLCCFLPQDKVASFAAMSPRELLHATMQAANEVRLPSWHSALIKTEAKLSILNTDYESNQHNLNKINEKVNELQEIVQASNERKQLEEQLDRYTLLKMHVEAGMARTEVENLKKRRAKIKAKHEAETKKYKPLFDLRLHNANQLTDATKAVQSKTDDASTLKQDIDKIRTRIEKEGESAEDIQTTIKNLRQTDRDRHDKIKTLEGKVEEQTRILNSAEVPDQAKAAEVDRKRTKLKQELIKLDSSDGDYQYKKAQIRDGAGRLQDRVTSAHSHIAKLKDVKRNRRQIASAKNPTCGYAMNWIEANMHHFEKEVYFPPAVEVEVTDVKYAGIVEQCFNRNTMFTFIAQTPGDYRILNKLNDEEHYYEIGRQKKRVRIATYQVTERDLDRINEPAAATPEQLDHYGLDGFATDFITAAPAVIAYLRALNIHTMAISLRNANVEAANANLNLRTFTYKEPSGFVTTQFKQSAYGKRAWQSQSTNITPRPTYFHQVVDHEAIRTFENQIETARAEQKQAEEQLIRLESEKTKRVSDREKLQRQMGQADDEQSAIKRLSRAIAQAKSEKEAAQRELIKIRNVPSVEQQRQTAQEKLQSSVKKRFELAMKGTPGLTKLEQLVRDTSEGCLDSIRHQASKNHLEPVCGIYQERVQEIKERFLAISDELREAKAAALDSAQLFTDHKSEMLIKWDKDLSQDFDEDEHTLGDVETLLADTEGDLSLQPEIDNAAEARLQIELKEQEDLNRLVSRQAAKKAKYDQLHDEAKNQFEPALEKLVHDVSTRFQEGLAKVKVIGQVRVRKTASYEEWALEILVKFRDSEDLQVLSHKRQSGGERSLTTIMYLESLMSLSRTPFSLVDEINQGMDQRNERAVHNLLVASTCKGTAGQYFLITPKLLTRLEYHPNMKILCINNGDWLPVKEENRFGDLKGILSNIERRKQAV